MPVCYAVFRRTLGLEMLRGDYVEPFLFGLKSAQATSLIFFLIALAAFIYCGVKDKSKQPLPKLHQKNNKKY
mgnify:CR=1 FL=1